MEYNRMDRREFRKYIPQIFDLDDPPECLWYRGSVKKLQHGQCAAVVGSRNMSIYGRQVVERLVSFLVSKGIIIISGFMYGVDRYAHDVAISLGGKTVAVLGWGITQALEPEDSKRAIALIDTGGLVISQWECQLPTRWTFPVRNRIVAALSSDVYVVEAAFKSGSLITARIAQALHRRIFAVPGPITSRTSGGTNSLIASGEAIPWIGTSDSPSGLLDTDPILAQISDQALTANDIALLLRKSVSEIGARLSVLTISGEVTEKDGMFYRTYARPH